MAHGMILGQTESGKTSLARTFAREMKRAGYGVLVLDPFEDPAWDCSWMTKDPAQFVATVKRSRRCFCFVDEVLYLSRRGHVDELEFLATRSRHWGMSCFFVSQRGPGCIPRTVRDQTSLLYLFNTALEDAKVLHKEWNRPAIPEVGPFLGQGEFLKITKWGPVERRRLFTPRKAG